jgi:hypothetical protein
MSNYLVRRTGRYIVQKEEGRRKIVSRAIQGPPGAAASLTIQEEGTPLTQRDTLNFVGSAFTAADDAGNERTNVTAHANLNAWAALTISADTLVYGNGSGTLATTALTSFGRSLLDDANAAAARSTLGLVIGTDVQAFNAGLLQIAGLADPNADRMLFWDDSAGSYAYLSASTGLAISGTALALTDTGVAADSYGAAHLTLTVTVDAQGRLTAIDTPTIAIDASQIISGTLPTSVIPALAVTEYLGSVADESEMLLLDGQKGDWCIREDDGLVYVVIGDDPTDPADWMVLSYPGAPVTEVNGQSGVVNLSYSDVGAAAASHSHSASDITSGKLAIAQGGTNATSFTGSRVVYFDGTGLATVTSILISGGSQVVISAQAKTDIPLSAQANASQTANLFEIRNSSGVAQTYVNASFGMTIGGTLGVTGLATFSTSPTSPGSGSNSERWGSGASTGTSTNSLAFGNGASVTGDYGTAVGRGATAGTGSVAIGGFATASGTRSFVLAYNSTSTHTDAFVFGSNGGVSYQQGGYTIHSPFAAPAMIFTSYDDTSVEEIAAFSTAWVTSTHASRKGRITISAYDTAAREGFRVESDGAAAAISLYGVAAVARQTISSARDDPEGALKDLLAALGTLGAIIDSSTAS